VELPGRRRLTPPEQLNALLERRLLREIGDVGPAVREAPVRAVEIAELRFGGDDAFESANELGAFRHAYTPSTITRFARQLSILIRSQPTVTPSAMAQGRFGSRVPGSRRSSRSLSARSRNSRKPRSSWRARRPFPVSPSPLSS